MATDQPKPGDFVSPLSNEDETRLTKKRNFPDNDSASIDGPDASTACFKRARVGSASADSLTGNPLSFTRKCVPVKKAEEKTRVDKTDHSDIKPDNDMTTGPIPDMNQATTTFSQGYEAGFQAAYQAGFQSMFQLGYDRKARIKQPIKYDEESLGYQLVEEEPQMEEKPPRRRHLLNLKIPKGKNISEPSLAIQRLNNYVELSFKSKCRYSSRYSVPPVYPIIYSLLLSATLCYYRYSLLLSLLSATIATMATLCYYGYYGYITLFSAVYFLLNPCRSPIDDEC
ncbi:uncharacterized protein TRIVIDRAFT_65246 [Trichoderma virens Gv29-8]|uniref:Uncharacterized protein n=1 Tax=Hypocrea virens (strain Gv29-8 / FGSC 10586) TaxID=413071 RepID=G9NAR6_HYPVG|nr:uncharacterized protein TRIVIDRAFT_65246 [Trichoderma virens Gv29-8]EHK15927.1 hypothetical protein TRIVIDRAFT_65246 [Trichoderma virens Gv29-8]UKZ56301.1 hypothetical protein TrVGV298_010136 [Trichoderma virens]